MGSLFLKKNTRTFKITNKIATIYFFNCFASLLLQEKHKELIKTKQLPSAPTVSDSNN